MDNLFYIKVGSLYTIVQAIPESTNTDTVTIEVRRLSDNYTWDFATTQFTSPVTSGNMTFINDILWKQSFTPPTEDTYIVTIEDTTLDVKYVQVLKAVGAVAQAGVTGTELTTLANLKEFLNISVTDDDTFLQNLITRISDDIEKECNRSFHAADYTEYYNGDGTNKLLLRQYPINSITSIHDDTERVWGSNTQIDNSKIIISKEIEGMVVLDGTTFTESDLENVKIVYNAGYSTIPTDLEQACIKRCAADYLESKGLVAGAAEEDRNPDKLRKQAQGIIDRYKKIR